MDIQRLLAIVVFSLSLMWLWEAWQTYSHPQPVVSTAVQTGLPASPSAIGVPTPSATHANVVPGAVAVTSAQTERGARAVIHTDVMRVEIDAHGGDLRGVVLSQYRSNEDNVQPFTLLQEQAGKDYFAQSGWVGTGFPTHKTVFEMPSGEQTLAAGQNTLKFSLKAREGDLELIKTYTFTRGSYLIEVDQQVINHGATPVSANAYFQFLRHGEAPAGESMMMGSYTGPAMYTEAGKFQKVPFADIGEAKPDHITQASDGWIGMIQHHFVSAWLLGTATDASSREFFTKKLGPDSYTAGMILPPMQVAAQGEGNLKTRLYVGPQALEHIEALAPGMEYVVDYGWLTVLAYPIFMLLKWIYAVVPNWGWAIILLTVIIKMAFYPLSAASYKSMAKMRKVAPKLQQVKDRYGDDKQKLHEQMMKVYSEEKINPLGGCLPMLVQIPVFIALYWVLMGAVELRQAPWALWISDLSAQDPYYILPVLMAVSMFVQQKMSPPPTDPIQAKIMMYMPIMFSVFFFFFPAGLVLYWIVNNLISIAQQWRINVVVDRANAVVKDGAKH
jgi:YidC/Oxa1 family membrane protein insertase